MADFRSTVIERFTGINLSDVKETIESLREEARQAEFNEEVLTERMAELELALEDANWMRLMFESEHEFTRDGIRKITDLARMMYIKNPLINRAVLVMSLYVWAQGVSVKYKNRDLNKVLQDFWDDEKNRTELTSHQAQMLKQVDYEVESNIFFVFFTRPSDGRVRVRTLPFDEVAEIVSDPEDSKTSWYYLRRWSEKKLNKATGRTSTKQRKAYYPDWKYTPKVKPAKIGDTEVMWNYPVYHVKTGGMSAWKFGVSQVYCAIDWARAYKEFLEDVASLMRAYSRFAWKRITKGKKAIAAEKAKLATTLASGGSSESETNPPPVTGAMAFLGEGTDLQPMQLRGAAISAEDGRRFLLMVAAGVGLPETYFGDVSVGTFATAKTMDRPTELAMKERQTFWTDVFRSIFNFVLLQAMKANDSPIKKLGRIEKTPDGDEIEETIVWNSGVNTMLDIDFPPILEKDIQAAVQAVVTALTLNGQQLTLLDEQTATRLILRAMAEDDVDEIMAELFPDGETVPAGRGEPSPTPGLDTPSTATRPPMGNGKLTPSEALVKEAARKLIEGIRSEMAKVADGNR
ncbi:MAG: hypothetical protein C4583_04320 [Anaerolineaceae bacterium]|nr:MAG: hypothetical protein C4583_04320 [Anaerolineaceae bacterium]